MKQMKQKENQKKAYEAPSLNVIKLENRHMLAASPLYPGSGGPDD